MCGISGIYGYATEAEPSALRGMLEVIRHRGPDDDGYYVDGSLAIGMRRLSIIDLAGGKQPIANEDGSIVVVFNGEIYNYQELAAGLRARGHHLRTASDTEVLVHLYEEHGDTLVHQLRGMFAFALWDARRRRLLVVRDRLGIKPLYYADLDGRFVFGSEIKSILRYPGLSPSVDVAALSAFLTLKYVPTPRTMFAGISALPSGHLLACDERGVRIQQYWDLSFSAGDRGKIGEDEALQELSRQLRESVRLHLVSDVPFGAFLSGGLDSSTIVALMSEILDRPVKTFSVGFEGEGVSSYSELPYARLVADRYRTDHHEVIVGAESFVDSIERIVWHLDQPIADDACVANYMVSELAGRHVKMVLTGEGGDELFAGYARYSGERLSPVFRLLPAFVKRFAVGASGRLSGHDRAKLALYALCQDREVDRFVEWFSLFNQDAKEELVSGGRLETADQTLAARAFAEQLARADGGDPLSRMLYVDTKLWLPDDLLARGDKTSMAASIEARVPLLDHKVVEFVASLPTSLKLRGLSRKYLLRRFARDLLPAEILSRTKKGFPIPLAVWFRGEARPFVRDLLSPAAVRRRDLFNPSAVGRLLNEHEAGLADHSSRIWALLGVEMWCRAFFDQPGAGQQRTELTTAGQVV